MRWLRITLIGLLLGLACAAAAAELFPGPRAEEGVPLYFSLEVRQKGHVVARPQLLGASGHDVRAVLRSRDGTPRMELLLQPSLHGSKVGLDMHLALPDEPGLGKSFSLRHAEEASLKLGPDVDVRVLAMRVQSPEFEAYMRNAPPIEESPDRD